ncbi:SNF2 family N-terminal domain-containing protein [Aspergillus flavus]|uniref:SNF2 family N-terminal domain-containing protein n=1 Tax=Aspergillus flavus TaxID=5059 RepID=A0A5N6GDQ7_ASPFL|nr:SNF2 family N-terminal domain-containing protein [Aspergillus flavus]
MSSNTPIDGRSLSILGPTSQWHRVIFDEAQSIRNDKSKTAIACRDVDATYRWCLTGTHVKNYLQVLYSLLQFLRISPGPELDVADMFCPPADGGCSGAADPQVRSSVPLPMTRILTAMPEGRSSWPILRLPPTTTEDVHVVLSDMEQVLYTAIERSSQARFSELRVDNLIHRGTSHVRSLLQSLQQTCCHPFLVPQLPQIVNDHCRAKAGLELNASRFTPEVVHRLRNSNGLLDCPVCFDPVNNPIIFFPCGHSTCNPCLAAMSPASTTPQGPWNAKDAMRCSLCRVAVDPGLATDYVTSVRSHHAPDQGSTEATGWYELLSKFLRWDARIGKGDIYSPAVTMGSYISPWVSSFKIDKALEIIQRVQDLGNGEKIIIFSQFTAFLDLVEIPPLQHGWVSR